MKRRDRFLVHGMPTDNIQALASSDVKKQIIFDPLWITQNRISGPPTSELPLLWQTDTDIQKQVQSTLSRTMGTSMSAVPVTPSRPTPIQLETVINTEGGFLNSDEERNGQFQNINEDPRLIDLSKLNLI